MEELRGQIGTYRIGDLVARGRSGDTFAAHAGDGRRLAIKVHDRPEPGRREAERLARVEHPGVVALLDHGTTTDGRTWLALPWIVGRTLTEVLATESPMPLPRVHRLIGQLADAIDALHQAGIVHGDLSPNNIIVGPDDRLTLLDLGASSDLDRVGGTVGSTTGLEVDVTPRYASPEVAEGQPAGPAADRYAVGLIAYEAITGAFPFPEVATPIAMLGHHASSDPVAPSEHRPDLPGPVEVALLGALAKDPASRPSTARRLAVALARDGTPGGRRRRSPRRRSPRWGRAVGVGALGIALLVGAGIGLGWLGGDEEPSEGRAEIGSGVEAALEATLEPTPWPAGRAAGLSCNRLQFADFERSPLPEGFYGGDVSNTVALVAGAGVDGTTALRVGGPDAYGLFAEIVPVGSAERLVFSAWLRQEGSIETSALYVDYLDAEYQQLTALRDGLPIGRAVGGPDGARVTITSEVPSGAAFAVPTVFKDGSPGSVLIDEAVFGPTTTCSDLAG